MGLVTMFLYRTFELDSRVEREAATLIEAGHDVRVLAVLDGGRPELEERDGYLIQRVTPFNWATHLATRVSEIGWLPRWIRSNATRAYHYRYWRNFVRRAAAAAPADPDLLIGHDLDALGAAVRVKGRTGTPLIYDAHELFPDLPTIAVRAGFERRLWMAYERDLLKRADAVFAVTRSRAEEMARRYDIPPPAVLRNVPQITTPSDAPDIRSHLGLPADRRIVLYLGGIQAQRGIEATIEAMAQVPEADLALMGPQGDPAFLEQMLALAARIGIAERMHVLPAVPPAEVVAVAGTVDVGVVANRNFGLNNYLSLPNKIFEYLGAGVPVVASDFPDMAGLLADYDAGEVCNPEDPESISAAIHNVIDDPSRLAELKANASKAGAELNWENERKILLETAERLGLGGEARPD